MRDRPVLNRRDLLTGRHSPLHGPADHFISSAVVTVLPSRAGGVAKHLGTIDGVEVHASQGSKIVVTIEGPSSGMLGERLTEITLMDGVISANMVYEYMDSAEGCDNGPSADAP